MLAVVGARRVEVIGGGPAGLTAAMTIKRTSPSWDVVVTERNPPEQTFGYGVGLVWSAFNRLADANPDCAAEIEATSITTSTWTIRRDGEQISAANSHGIAISRTDLLRILGRHAQAAGVEVRVGSTAIDDLPDADVVLGADGVGSGVRTALADQIGATVTTGDLAYLWCGADIGLERLNGMVLNLARTPLGPAAAHVMPFAADACTFQVDATTDVVDGWDLSTLETTFAELLGSARLRTKRSDWLTFATVRCDRWHAGNVALLGDAAHTAHYTVGSGTALAIDDGLAVAEALTGAGSISDAFTAYEAERQPRVEHIQARAARSERWWSTLRLRIELPLPQLMLSYLTRTGALSLGAVTATNRELVDECRALARRLETAPAQAPVVEVTSTDIDVHVDAAAELAKAGATSVRLTGPSDRDAVTDRLDVAERVRARYGVTTIVHGTAEASDHLTLGLLTDRTDHVEIT